MFQDGVESNSTDILTLAAALEVDLSAIGDLLNSLLVLMLQIPSVDPSRYDGVVSQIEKLVAKILCFLNGLDMPLQNMMYDLLTDLLRAIEQLLESLVIGVVINIGGIYFLVTDVLSALQLRVDANVFKALGNLLQLNVDLFVNN